MQSTRLALGWQCVLQQSPLSPNSKCQDSKSNLMPALPGHFLDAISDALCACLEQRRCQSFALELPNTHLLAALLQHPSHLPRTCGSWQGRCRPELPPAETGRQLWR